VIIESLREEGFPFLLCHLLYFAVVRRIPSTVQFGEQVDQSVGGELSWLLGGLFIVSH